MYYRQLDVRVWKIGGGSVSKEINLEVVNIHYLLVNIDKYKKGMSAHKNTEKVR